MQYRIDSWNNDQFKIYLENQLIYQQGFTSSGGLNLCGYSNNDQIIKISIQAQHNSKFAVVYMEAQEIDNDNNESWGISLFTLSIDPCPAGCDYCESDSYVYCKKWSLLYLDLQTDSYYHYDQYLYKLQNCTSICSFTKTLQYHNKIIIRLKVNIFNGNELYFIIGINGQSYLMHLSQNNFKLGQLFDVLLSFSYHTTNQVNVLIERITTYTLRINALEILIQHNDDQFNQFILGCLNIIQNNCYECKNGWIFDFNTLMCIQNKDDLSLKNDHLQLQPQQSRLIFEYSSLSNQNYFSQECKFNWKPDKIMYYWFFILNLQLQTTNQQDYFIQGNICWKCENGWIFDQTFSRCIRNTGNLLDLQYEPLKYDESDLTQKFISLSNLNQQYFQCQSGWIFDLIQSICIPICGNKVVQGTEQCDGEIECQSCQFFCNANCQQCTFGICQSCIFGYFLNTNYVCEPICGDGELIPYLEQCDDSNTEVGDGCNNCEFECTENQIQVMCTTCLFGYKLQQNICVPNCGDQIVLPEYEDCDDGNDEKYDGCYECKYYCDEKCILCKNGVCEDKCSYGEIFLNNKCESVCGNKIVTGLEECDDGNTIQHDGCHQCQYSCTLFCNYCQQGICLECQDDYELQENSCQYIDKCGNGFIRDQEECDDGNLEANDGCNKCIQEENWICNQESPSQCVYQIQPKIILTYLNNTLSIQYVKLQFSQEIYIIDQSSILSKSMQVNISDLNAEFYNITVFPIIEASSNLSAAEYDLSIEIFKLLSWKPTLNIRLNQEVVNSLSIELINKQSQVQLQTPSYLSQSQKQNSETLGNSNEKIIYGLGAISIFSFFIGDAVVFQQILKILQYQSYLKYINVEYPQNLFIFFQSTNIVSVSAIVKYTNLNYYLNKYSLKQGPLETGGKFALYKYDADLILNLSCQILQLIGFVFLIIAIKILQKIIFRKYLILKFIDWMNDLQRRYKNENVLKINKAVYSAIKGALQAIGSFAEQGLRTLFIVNSQDLIFKAFLFLNYLQLKFIRDYIQLVLSFFIIVGYIVMIFMKQPQKYQLATHDTQIDKIYIIHSFVFLGLLVFCSANQIQQIVLISLSNVYYMIGLITKSKTFTYPKFIQIVVEAIVILFTLTSLLYVNDLKFYISNEVKIQIGWVHIGILISLLAETSKFFVAKGKILFEQIKKMIEKNKIQRAPRKLFYEITM